MNAATPTRRIPSSTPQPSTQTAPSRPLSARYAPRQPGTGYGRSSGYAVSRHYLGEESPFRG